MFGYYFGTLMLSEACEPHHRGGVFSISVPIKAAQISDSKTATSRFIPFRFQVESAQSRYTEASQKVTKIPLNLWDSLSTYVLTVDPLPNSIRIDSQWQ